MKKCFIEFIVKFICYSIIINLLYQIIIFAQPQRIIPIDKYVKNEDVIQELSQEKNYDKAEKSTTALNNKQAKVSEQTAINRKILDNQFPKHYLDKAISNGDIVRWNPSTFPLKVYIEDQKDIPEYFYSEVVFAFLEWEEKTNKFINFRFVDSSKKADIVCKFPKNDIEADEFSKKFGGITHPKVSHGTLQKMNITFSTKYHGIDKFLTPNAIHSIALHEIGHALGILGHSTDPNNIMYPSTQDTKRRISDGDISTIKLIYSIVPDISNKNFSKEEKEKFLTIADIFGDKDERLDIELSNTIEANKITNNDPTKLVHIANLYYQKKNYKKAIENYELAIKKIFNNDKILAKLHYQISLCYLELKEYDSALSYAQESQKINPDDNTLELEGRIYYKAGDNDSAKKILVNLLNRNSQIYNAYITLANIYQKEKDKDNWNKLYYMGIENFPDNPPLRRTKR